MREELQPLIDRHIRFWKQNLGTRTRQDLSREVPDRLLDSGDVDEHDRDFDAVVRAIIAGVNPPARAVPPPRQGREERGGRRIPPVEPRTLPGDGRPSAPFRFVTLAESPVPAPASVRSARNHLPIPGGVSGSITVEWAAETPLLVGDVDERTKVASPVKLGDDYVLPGASLRGMVRATMEIVCRAKLGSVNRRHTYGVRDFDHVKFAEHELPDGTKTSHLDWRRLQAGWLRKIETKVGEEIRRHYEITPCDKGVVRIRDLPSLFNGAQPTANGRWHRQWLTFDLGKRYRLAGYAAPESDIVNFSKPEKFRVVSAAGAPITQFVPDPNGLPGVYVFSDRLPSVPKDKADESPAYATKKLEFERRLDAEDAEPDIEQVKKVEYVFIDRPGAAAMRLNQEAFDRFYLINSCIRGNAREPDGSLAVLWQTLEAGNRIPVFFAGDLTEQSKLDIGLTRLFKVAHDYGVADKIPASHSPSPAQPDMVEALFGHVYEEDDVDAAIRLAANAPALARKGRIAFGFAKLVGGAAKSGPLITSVMMAPRASFAPFYLDGENKDWSAKKATFAGRKRYFPRFPDAGMSDAAPAIRSWLQSNQGNANENAASSMHLLEPVEPGRELVFAGDIRLHNATAEEVGALLWALTHGGDPAKPYRHLIGRAKTAGAGQLRVRSIHLDLEGHDTAGDQLTWTPEAWEMRASDGKGEGWVQDRGASGERARPQSMTPYLRAFDAHMTAVAGADWCCQSDILELLGAASPLKGASIAAAGKHRYMPLEEHKGWRDAVKLRADDARKPPARSARLLAAPAIAADELKRPYLAG